MLSFLLWFWSAAILLINNGVSKDGKLAVDSKSGKPDLVVAYNTFTGVEGLVLDEWRNGTE